MMQCRVTWTLILCMILATCVVTALQPAKTVHSIIDSSADLIEPEYYDAVMSEGEGSDDVMMEQQNEVHVPRMLKPAQFREYLHSLTTESHASNPSVNSFVETSTRLDAAQRLSKCKVSLNSWLHKCVF